jgi:hypothetical protein
MSGLIRELIRKPLVKGMLRGHLKDITPEGARSLVKTILWQDIEVIFGILGSLPAFINAVAAALVTLAEEVNEKVSPEITKGFVASIIKDVDQAGLKDSARAVATLISNLIEASPQLKALIIEKGPGTIAQVINSVTVKINELCSQDPAFISTFIARVIEDIDKHSLNEASLNLAEAFLNQQMGLIAWTFKLLKRRVATRLKRLGL